MLVTVKIYYYDVFGKGLIELNLKDGATLKDAINELDEKFGDALEEKTGMRLEKALGSHLRVFLNGRFLSLPADIEHKLNHGDELIILTPVSGG